MRQVRIRVLPDDASRVRIHWFEWIETGAAERKVLDTVGQGRPTTAPRRGRIACMPQLTDLNPKVEAGFIRQITHSDDPRAVTCPEGKAAEAFKAALAANEKAQEGTEAV